MATRDELIEAVRSDKRIGRNTCSTVDECLEDDELWEIISEAKTPQDAVKLAYDFEGLQLEQGLNQRWGEDDDPQLAAYREWKENR